MANNTGNMASNRGAGRGNRVYNTDTSSISSNTSSISISTTSNNKSEAELDGINDSQLRALGAMDNFPAEAGQADGARLSRLEVPDNQTSAYADHRDRNIYPRATTQDIESVEKLKAKPGGGNVHLRGTNPEAAQYNMAMQTSQNDMRERNPYTANDNQYYNGQPGHNNMGYAPQPPQGYPYGHLEPQSFQKYPLAPTTTAYQRYTFIVVCGIALMSAMQLRSSLYPNQGVQQNAFNANNGGYSGLNSNAMNGLASPQNGNNGNGMNTATNVGNANNNGNNNMMMGGYNDGGNEVPMTNNADAGKSLTSSTGVVDAGMEKYPLLDLSNFKDNWDEWDPTDVPMFFHIPKAGGSTVKDIIGTCHRFVMATETGITDGHADDKEIEVVYPGGIGPKGQDRSPFVNVDTTTVEGIARASEMGFADSGLADAVVTYFLYEANELFTPSAKGRVFTVFRHPIERAISLFFYIQIADWEPTYDPTLQDMTIEDWAKSPKIENNWLTRSLSNQPEGDLTDDHLNLAMEVIRRKFMVGLMTEIEATMERFERFFRWTYHVNPPNQENCRDALLNGGSNSNKSKSKKPKPGSEAWELISWQNQYDLQLYEYIESLFVEQEQFVADIAPGYRNIDATCCKCDPATFPPEGFTCPLAILF